MGSSSGYHGAWLTQSVNVRVLPRGPTGRKHIEQLRFRYASEEDSSPGESVSFDSENKHEQRPMTVPPELVSEPLIPDIHVDNDSADEHNKRKNPRLPSGTKYG